MPSASTAELGTWLRQQREQRGWSRYEMSRRLCASAREAGDSAVPEADTIEGYLRRWETGRVSIISERYKLLFCRVLDIPVTQFGPHAGRRPGSGRHPVATWQSPGCRVAPLRLPWNRNV